MNVTESKDSHFANVFVLVFHRMGESRHRRLHSSLLWGTASSHAAEMGGHVTEIHGSAGTHTGISIAQVFDESCDNRVNRILCPALGTNRGRALKEN